MTWLWHTNSGKLILANWSDPYPHHQRNRLSCFFTLSLFQSPYPRTLFLHIFPMLLLVCVNMEEELKILTTWKKIGTRQIHNRVHPWKKDRRRRARCLTVQFLNSYPDQILDSVLVINGFNNYCLSISKMMWEWGCNGKIFFRKMQQ